jgi:glycosyltransferase involved in cell wall biosynthesis
MGAGGGPAVSVVIPTYNHRDYVVRALESVWAQSFRDFEIVVVNDGSPDDTVEVLRPHVQAGRIHRFIDQANAGQGAARNRGIAESRGEFIALLDDDDFWPEDKLERQVAALRANPGAVVVYGQPVPVGADGEPREPLDPYGNPLPWPWESPGGHVHRAFSERCWMVSPGQALVRRAALGGRPFDPSIRNCDDWDLWLRLAERAEFLYEDRPALFYRLHDANASRDVLKMRRNEFKLLRKHTARAVGDPRRLRYMAYRLAYYWYWTAPWLVEQVKGDLAGGHPAAAREKLRYAALLRPYYPLRRWFRDMSSEAGRQLRSAATAE